MAATPEPGSRSGAVVMSVATMTASAAIERPSLSRTVGGICWWRPATLSTSVWRWMWPGGSPAASWPGRACMPAAGRPVRASQEVAHEQVDHGRRAVQVAFEQYSGEEGRDHGVDGAAQPDVLAGGPERADPERGAAGRRGRNRSRRPTWPAWSSARGRQSGARAKIDETARMATRVDETVTSSAQVEVGPAGETVEIQAGHVNQPGEFRVGGIEHLEAPVAQEAVDYVGADPVSHGVGGVDDMGLSAPVAEVAGGGQPGQAGPDDEDVAAVRKFGGRHGGAATTVSGGGRGPSPPRSGRPGRRHRTSRRRPGEPPGPG